VIENRSGAKGALGSIQMAATAAPDGYTIALITRQVRMSRITHAGCLGRKQTPENFLRSSGGTLTHPHRAFSLCAYASGTTELEFAGKK
jgi:hypothetical protein